MTWHNNLKKKFHLETVFTKHELGFYITPASLPILFLHMPPSPSTSLTPPPPSCLMPPSRLRLRLPHASHFLEPHLTSRHASLSLTSCLTPGDFKSIVLLLSLSSLGCAKRRQLSLSLSGSGCANFLWENKKKLGSFFLYKSPLFSLALLYHFPSRSNCFLV